MVFSFYIYNYYYYFNHWSTVFITVMDTYAHCRVIHCLCVSHLHTRIVCSNSIQTKEMTHGGKGKSQIVPEVGVVMLLLEMAKLFPVYLPFQFNFFMNGVSLYFTHILFILLL